MSRLAVIIVNYNVEYFLRQCLHSVFQACKNIDAEIWVVDNNSVDGSVAMVRDSFPETRLIENRENVGFSKANNQAIRESNSEYVLLLNPDTVVEEDTFEKVIGFMDDHPDAGGLGVKMIDGKGRFLPESKRGVPTPAVAFYKIFGLSALFPKSKIFGQYHLGYLSNDEVHEVDILSGAFMLMRREALDKTGLLDEAFFMYGEDIDLSWRLVKAGYSNYYFPHTRIIHYKGESTKKGSLNYVKVFYKAMVIFAEKHFSQRNARAFGQLINLAIYLRASLAVLNRGIKKAAVPLLDFLAMITGLAFVTYYYQHFTGKSYDEDILQLALPAYVLTWQLSFFFNGGYDFPFRFKKLIAGIIWGTGIILIGYSLLPEDLRFSRAIILLGSASSFLALAMLRLIYRGARLPAYRTASSTAKRLAIIGSQSEIDRILHLMKQARIIPGKVFRIAPDHEINQTGFNGNIDQIQEVVRIHRIDEVIFCASDIPSNRIIDLMARIEGKNLNFKIAPPESHYIIGSNSIERGGELFILEINPISKPENRRNKRILDIGLALLFLISYPLTVWWVKSAGGFMRNILAVLFGKKTWVGYASSGTGDSRDRLLPKLAQGVLSPLDTARGQQHTAETALKLNTVYARDYRKRTDLYIVFKAFKELGRK